MGIGTRKKKVQYGMEEVYIMSTIIKVSNISREFVTASKETFKALHDITIEIPEQKLVILKGRSGSGKTTLINIIGALDQPTSG